MQIVDMHCDSLLKVSDKRGLVTEYNVSKKNSHLQFFAAFCPKANQAPEVRRQKIMSMLNTYLYECQRLGIHRITSGKELFDAEREEGLYSILTLEGGGGLFADSDELVTLKNAGLAVLGLAWDKNELASSAFDDIDDGLTEEGVRMIDKCSELGIIVDVSHLSDKSFYEALEISKLPLLATHSNFRELCSSPRNLTRDMAQKIAARGGVIGLNLYPSFLNDSKNATKDDILRHVGYGLDLLGDSALGFGFDIDGIEKYPDGFRMDESIHDSVVDLLLSHYSAETVRKLASLNVINFLKNNLDH